MAYNPYAPYYPTNYTTPVIPQQYQPQQALMQAQQMLNSGQMSQEQYSNILQIAGILSGQNNNKGGGAPLG